MRLSILRLIRWHAYRLLICLRKLWAHLVIHLYYKLLLWWGILKFNFLTAVPAFYLKKELRRGKCVFLETTAVKRWSAPTWKGNFRVPFLDKTHNHTHKVYANHKFFTWHKGEHFLDAGSAVNFDECLPTLSPQPVHTDKTWNRIFSLCFHFVRSASLVPSVW